MVSCPSTGHRHLLVGTNGVVGVNTGPVIVSIPSGHKTKGVIRESTSFVELVGQGPSCRVGTMRLGSGSPNLRAKQALQSFTIGLASSAGDPNVRNRVSPESKDDAVSNVGDTNASFKEPSGDDERNELAGVQSREDT